MENIDIIKLLLDTGAYGVMTVALWAFMTGRLMSKKTHDEVVAKIIETAEKSMEILATKITSEISSEVAKGVRQGYVDGYFEVNGGRSKHTDE